MGWHMVPILFLTQWYIIIAVYFPPDILPSSFNFFSSLGGGQFYWFGGGTTGVIKEEGLYEGESKWGF